MTSAGFRAQADRLAPGRLWSLWDMLEIVGKQFLGAFTELAQAKTFIKSNQSASNEALLPETTSYLLSLVANMTKPIFDVGAKSAWVSANRLRTRLESNDATLTFGTVGEALADIESRFVDHLGFVQMYVVNDDQVHLLSGAESLVKGVTAERFTSSRFDVEEAAKCLCLSRATASVFHSMRVLELALKALAKHLSIPDPTKPAERNWATILKAIKLAIDEQYPIKDRTTGSRGSILDVIYAHLDATRNPWRNATMHVDVIYTLDEAQHIFNCTKALLNKMAELFDENGIEAPTPAFPGLLSALLSPAGGMVGPVVQRPPQS